MIMNSHIREELTQLLADYLDAGNYQHVPRESLWRAVAEDAMEFIYGEEEAQGQGDPNPATEGRYSSADGADRRCRCGCGLPAVRGQDSAVSLKVQTSMAGPEDMGFTGVAHHRPMEPLVEQFYASLALQGPTEGYDPAQLSGFGLTVQSPPAPDAAGESS